jgi:hypothetical protein
MKMPRRIYPVLFGSLFCAACSGTSASGGSGVPDGGEPGDGGALLTGLSTTEQESLCNSLAGHIGGYDASKTISCGDGFKARSMSWPNDQDCVQTFASVTKDCSATVSDAVTCITAPPCSASEIAACTAVIPCVHSTINVGIGDGG